MQFWAEHVEWLGLVDYRTLLARMVDKRDQIVEGKCASSIWLVQHNPVVTMGRNAVASNLLMPKEKLLLEHDIDVVEVERGGDLTYHGPSQLMVYPIGKIGRVLSFLTRFSEVFIEALTGFDVNGAEWKKDPAGIWVGDRKIVACGLHLRKQVVMHGFALNLHKTSEWRFINPCGLTGSLPTSIEEETGLKVSVEEVADTLKRSFAQTFAKRSC